MTDPPVWSDEEFENDLNQAIEVFRRERMEEPLELYLEAFDHYRDAVENLLETTVDLADVREVALDVVTDPDLLEALRYLPGPPMSADDLKVLADASLAPTRLERDPGMALRVVETVLMGLDRHRFPWVTENREPTEPEREAAALASASLLASSRVQTTRRNEAKDKQEQAVVDRLLDEGLEQVEPRRIATLKDAPAPGQFCRESLFGTRKADIVVGLYDNRVMPTECKVSNSSVNSIKRLNNDAAVKAVEWTRQFGTRSTVPAAVLSGVFKLQHLKRAQDDGLTIFWAHDLDALARFVASTMP